LHQGFHEAGAERVFNFGHDFAMHSFGELAALFQETMMFFNFPRQFGGVFVKGCPFKRIAHQDDRRLPAVSGFRG
jgi:hypothetical protein